LDYNRYMYVRGNAMKYNDPSGHCVGPAMPRCVDMGGKLLQRAVAGLAALYAAYVVVDEVSEDSGPPPSVQSAPDMPQEGFSSPAVDTSVSGFGDQASLDNYDGWVITLDNTTESGITILQAKRGPKVWPEGPHNDIIDRRIGELKGELGAGWEHIGGGTLTEEWILTPGGTKSARRPDITFHNPTTGEYYRENVGKTTTDGNIIPREVEALNDIEAATGQRPIYTPYD